ncbi:MAG: hypothetical protein KDA84_07560, partial [Planctomycetaceae bacterium]|nr:hypothetical protein [Planctomycetaceae bacterium]
MQAITCEQVGMKRAPQGGIDLIVDGETKHYKGGQFVPKRGIIQVEAKTVSLTPAQAVGIEYEALKKSLLHRRANSRISWRDYQSQLKVARWWYGELMKRVS